MKPRNLLVSNNDISPRDSSSRSSLARPHSKPPAATLSPPLSCPTHSSHVFLDKSGSGENDSQPIRQPISFSSLPPELRTPILRYVCVHSSPITINPWNGKLSVTPPIELFLASSGVYAEASLLFYAANTFELEIASALWAPPEVRGPRGIPSRWHKAPLNPRILALPAARLLRSLIFRPPARFRRDWSTDVTPQLQGLILHGGLRELEVRLKERHGVEVPSEGREVPTELDAVEEEDEHPAPTSAGSSTVAGATTHPVGSHDPSADGRSKTRITCRGKARHRMVREFISLKSFQDLLRMLADPDLEKVRLCVPRVHMNMWCEFHAPWQHENRQEHQEEIEREGLALENEELEWERWVELDWRAVVLAFGAEDVLDVLNAKRPSNSSAMLALSGWDA